MEEDPFGNLGLKSVTMHERSRFSAFFQTLRSPLSDYTFAQLFTWGNSLRILWKEIRGHLCVFANGTGDLTLLMPPIGDTGSDCALKEAFEVMDAYNAAAGCPGRSRVEYVSEELLARFDATRLSLTPMGADYLYDTQRMIDLAGGDLASKRQLKNRFMRNFEHRVEAYDPALHRSACVDLLRTWKSHQDANAPVAGTSDALKRQKEALACELALEHAGPLGLKGLVVHVRPANAESAAASGLSPDAFSLRGFTFGEELGTEQSSILIEKTDLQVRGLAQFIFSEFCGRNWSHLPLVNAGDDWGLESLTWTKMSYRPVKLLQKHVIRMNAPVTVAVKPPLPVAEPKEAEVRAARKGDLEAALVLEQRCFSAHCLTKRQLGYLQRRPSAVFMVAEQEGRLIGQGISLVRTHKKGQTGRIYSLSVSEEARGKRIGLRLLRSMMAKLAERGVKRVYLEVEETNGRAIRLYERNGFKRVGRLDDYYGDGQHGLHMMCQLGAAVPA
jgi:ribosomal protein S18 acetylase RimI-like enzyme